MGIWSTGSGDVGLIQSTKAPKLKLSTAQFPVSTYAGSSKNLKDLNRKLLRSSGLAKSYRIGFTSILEVMGLSTKALEPLHWWSCLQSLRAFALVVVFANQ